MRVFIGQMQKSGEIHRALLLWINQRGFGQKDKLSTIIKEETS